MSPELRSQIEALMLLNRRQEGAAQYTVPSVETYPYQWFWDSCFHAIILSHLDPKAAQAELDALFSVQYEDGLIAHVTYWNRQHILDVDWGLERTSHLIQPPIIAYATWRTYQASADDEWLTRSYPNLARYYDHLLSERDIRGVSLIGYVNPDESGEDNSPRFDAALGLPPQHPVEANLERRYNLFATHRDCRRQAACTSEHFWVEDVPANTFLIWNLEYLATIAETVGRPHDATHYRTCAKRVAAAMREHMWHNGHFTELTSRQGTKTTSKTWAWFVPLITKQYTQAEAVALIEDHLLDEGSFWRAAGIPTVAADDAAYDPAEPPWGEAWQHPHWRGPIWMPTHWLLYHALPHYGYTELADTIRDKAIALVTNAGFREYFHPDTGVGMGAHGFTWGALTLDMQPPFGT